MDTVCLPVDWDNVCDQSSVWCNGKKIKTFTARVSYGQDKTTFVVGKYCLIYGQVYKIHNIADNAIKLHHKVLCERYLVDHDPISID